MLKAKLLYQWTSSNKGEIVENNKIKSIKIDKNGLIYFIEILSTKPIDILKEK
jgi:hypothetical protein